VESGAVIGKVLEASKSGWKKTGKTAHKTAASAFTPLFGEMKVLMSATPKAVTPFGGLISFVAFLE